MVPAALLASPQSLAEVSPSSTQRAPVIHTPPLPKNFDKLATGSNFVGPTTSECDIEAIPKTSNQTDLVDNADIFVSELRVSILKEVEAEGKSGLVTINADVDATLIKSPPSSLNLESKVPPELLSSKSGPVWLGPAVIVMPELLLEAVVSITKISSKTPPVSVTTKALVELLLILTKESNWAVALTSRSPEVSKSLVVVIKLAYPVASVPNLE